MQSEALNIYCHLYLRVLSPEGPYQAQLNHWSFLDLCKMPPSSVQDDKFIVVKEKKSVGLREHLQKLTQLGQSVEIIWQIPTNNFWPCSQRIHLLIQICHFWKLFQSCREPGDLSLSFSKLYRFSPQGRSLGRKIWMSQVLLLELPWPSFSH